MKKAPEAFRTISEVSDILDTPAHVLRFWESKFYQIRPVKRAGGRRYYRPDDLALLAGIRLLLQDQGMTIRGVQKVLQEQGVRHVASLAPDLVADEIHEAGSDTAANETGPTKDSAESRRNRPDDLVAPPPRPAATARPVPPMPLLPEASETAPEAPRSAAAMRSPSSVPEAPGQKHADDRTEPVAAESDETTFPAPPLSPTPQSDEAKEGDMAPEQTGTGQPLSEQDSSSLPTSEPAATKRQPVTPAPDLSDQALNLSEIAYSERPARVLRGLPRDALAAKHDTAAILARRIDALLDRMSDASGAGRW